MTMRNVLACVKLKLAVSCVAVAALVGCATEKHPEARSAVNSYYLGDFGGAREQLRKYSEKTDEDFVLNNLRMGSASLSDYDLKDAESAFYKAYEVINTGGVNDPGRATAAALIDEKVKVWKGEPYERAMANFYLGVIYYAQSDYNNARAAFENALFKLRDYGEGKNKDDEYRSVESDFVIAYLMLGHCWQKLGDDEKAHSMFERVKEIRPDLKALADENRWARANTLLVIDYGQGPRKVLNGDNSLVTFVPNPAQVGPVRRPQVVVDGKQLNVHALATPPVDLLAIAQDRRWQSIDTIRLTKSIAGVGLMAGGAYAASRRNEGTALGLLAAGALLKASATGDVRHWEMLPRSVFLLPLRLSPGKHDLHIGFADGTSQTWRDIIAPEEGKEATYYFRMLRANNGVHQWPVGDFPRIEAPVFVEKTTEKRVTEKAADPETTAITKPPVIEKSPAAGSVYDR